ncbi:hypothetical protein [Legionella jordanis]|uniref:Secreted protein n=1 Tax=Legionella jordanis TaxID=456 RepID=A0A0W0VEY8_9GAMM|nr:hypothetical protein [Legionella jordanis]KTD18445.1 hypothetical protein Ljor_2751 [Legionella jordanis]RMX05350.1 hypothetical protein EAW55_01440 [Legionella jordanis]RMX20801.1 hypothetical protein EAS68_05620 [Legionella jordanis]VEH13207.1 Uncharacterised protein [Legionella jordanis]HAT8715018.1 hypothetical protein [Legionella jordanis]
MPILKSICFTALFIVTCSASAAQMVPCFDEAKIKPIVEDLHHALQKDFCAQGVLPSDLQWVTKTALPQVMNKSFLGVEPPPNWQSLTDEIVQDCFKEGNLCKKESQRQFVECLQVKSPAIFLQLGPWMADNCKVLNQEIVENWPRKKEQVLDLINQFQQQTQTKKDNQVKPNS